MKKNKIIIVAPHLIFPLRNGADVYIANKWGAVDSVLFNVIMLAADGLYESTSDGWVCLKKYACTHNSKLKALFIMLTTGVDYTTAKFNTYSYKKELKSILGGPVELVVCSYASTHSMIKKVKKNLNIVVESHNFDKKYYLDRAEELLGIKRSIAKLNAARADKLYDEIDNKTPIIALGVSDENLFKARCPSHTIIRSNLGYDLVDERKYWPDNDCITLSFLGSLSTTMNKLPLVEFIDCFLPHIRTELNYPLNFRVIGSNPDKSLVEKCRRNSVELYSNVDDEKLDELLTTSHFLVMPFPNNNGLKLKFSTAVSKGISILSFIDPPDELLDSPYVFVSNDPVKWVKKLENIIRSGHNEIVEANESLRSISSKYSWSNNVLSELQFLFGIKNEA